MATQLEALKERLYDIDALNSAAAIMSWDQQTYMPRGGAAARAEHLGILTRMLHEQFTSDETGKLIESSAKSAEGDDAAMVRRVKRDFDLATKIPSDLVAEKSRLSTLAHEKWVHARANNDFQGFAPTLEKMFEIARQEATYLGYKEHMYDALLDQYEEGATAADVRQMFDTLKGPLSELVKEIAKKPAPDDSALYGKWDEHKQSEFTEMMVKAIGFDMERGRQDTAPHPFCTGWSVGDIRLTTRYKEYLGSAIFGSLHEAGHGMYEQGSPVEWDRSPLRGGISLGVHESQSRLWENIVGRSKAFWTHFLPLLQEKFPEVRSFTIDTFYRAINKVRPSFIRVEADEVTYNLHILIRFEIECAVLTGDLKVADIPQAWNDKYEAYLGIRPKTDSEGCLQDVHWSGAMIGYFPTYSMGNLLSYQIWHALKRDIPDVDDHLTRGDCSHVLDWLQRKIYRMGRKATPKELVLQVTGKPMGAEDYLTGLTDKYREIYGLS